MEAIYKEILQQFTYKPERDSYQWLKQPFIANKRCMASNTIDAVTTPLVSIDGLKDLSEKVKHFYPAESNLNRVVWVEEIEAKLAELPSTDDYHETSVECGACAGHGDIDHTFWYAGTGYDLVFDCPVCKGIGQRVTRSDKPTGVKLYNENQYFGIGNSAFTGYRIEKILWLAKKLNVNEVVFTSQVAANKPTVLTIGAVELLIMPAQLSEKSELVVKIEL